MKLTLYLPLLLAAITTALPAPAIHRQDNATGPLLPELIVTPLPSSLPTLPKPDQLEVRDEYTAPWAKCAYTNAYYGKQFRIPFAGFGIDDAGKRLKKEERGCGALTGWKYKTKNDGKNATASFTLPQWFKKGCVERAIHSAGGPVIRCKKYSVDGGFWGDGEDAHSNGGSASL